MKQLKLGDTVNIRFLGDKFESKVIKVINKNTYKLRTKQGTIIPLARWKKECEVNKKGEIIAPWYIES
jgi:ribosomal 50S subunit-recycling heat shock protein